MTIRPLLSHRRQNQRSVRALKDTLQLYGAGGWKDTDDLGIGTRTSDEIRRAILEDTGGFIWWGTRLALASRTINEIEIPTALERGATAPHYPIVPLFIDVRPGRDRSAIDKALGKHAELFLERNGLMRVHGESPAAFRVRVARRYVRDAVAMIPDRGITVAFRALGEPSGDHDLTFDWRALLDPRTRVLREDATELMIDALTNARDAFQTRATSPLLRIDSDLPLPLAVLIGFEWRISTRLRLDILQRTGSNFEWIPTAGSTAPAPAAVRTSYTRNGPSVVVVTCRNGAPGAAVRYADEVDAAELVELHAPGLLRANAVRGLARAAAAELAAAADSKHEKHLLILGPAALAFMIGAAANAAGKIIVPFWNGSCYVAPVTVGG